MEKNLAIGRIIEFKESVLASENLENDFYDLVETYFSPIDDFFTDDLSDVYEVIAFLTEQIKAIHQTEERQEARVLSEQHLSFKQVAKQVEDAARAHRIYYFNDSSWQNYVIGDIHSDTISIKAIMKRSGFFKKVLNQEKVRLVFLGDYVDRGKAHIKLIFMVFLLKYLFPQNIYMLRGNHDMGSYKDGQVIMGVRIPEKDDHKDWFLPYLKMVADANKTFKDDIIAKITGLFDDLAILCFFLYEERAILGVHGGLPRAAFACDPKEIEFLQKLEENALNEENTELSNLSRQTLALKRKLLSKNAYSHLTNITALTDDSDHDFLDRPRVNGMVWSDPAVEDVNFREDFHRFRYSEDTFNAYRQRFDFDILFRGHQVQPEGHKKFFQGNLINIFSSGQIYNDGENINDETAYMRVPRPQIIYLDDQGEIIYLDLS